MTFIYKIAIPSFLALILIILLVALWQKRFIGEALSREEFLTVNETVARITLKYLKADNFLEPFSALSQKQFQEFADELQRPSIARLTIWNRDQVIVFSNLTSIIGFYSPDHEDLKRLFAEETPFFIVKKEETNEPVQSEIGEFLDIYTPIRISGKVVGAVEIHSVIAGILAPIEMYVSTGSNILVAASVSILAIVLVVFSRDIAEHKRAEEQIQHHLNRITTLREIDHAITSTLDLESVLDLLLEKIDLIFPCPAATMVRLFNRDARELEFLACRNMNKEEWKARDAQSRGGRAKVVFETRSPLAVRNVQTDPQSWEPEFFRKYGLVSYLGIPLIAKDDVLGVLSFYTKEEHEFSNEEIEFLSTLATQAAIAIHNSQLYEEMKNLAGDLARSNRVKDEFLSVMSHELRTPLNVVMGYTGMIKDGLFGKINPEQEKALEKVISRAKDQLTLISGILQATQMEAERVKVESHEVNLGKFLNDLKSTYDVPLEKKLALTWDYPSDLPTIATDSGKLKQILQNLINNAIKFTEKGSVTISARVIKEAISDQSSAISHQESAIRNSESAISQVEFKVADTGAGIPKEHFPFIFEKFKQVDSSETRLYGGVGLGLYIVKKFTEMLGGKVEAASAVGKGSTFTVTIPCDIRQSAIDSQSLRVNT